MVRHIWFGCGLVIASLLAYYTYGQLPQIVDYFTPRVLQHEYVLLLRNDPFLAVSGFTSFGAVFAFIGIFVVLAMWDGIAIRTIRKKLEKLHDRQLSGTAPTVGDLIEAFADSPDFAPHAMACAATLEGTATGAKSPGDDAFTLRSSVPPHVFFSPRTLVEDNLYLWIFKSLPFLVFGVGAFCFAGSVIINPGFSPGDATPVTDGDRLVTLATFRAGLIAVTIAGFVAFLLAQSLRILLAFRASQANRLASLVGALFPGGAEARFLAQAARNSLEAARELSASMTRLGSDIHADMVEHAQRVLDATQVATDSIVNKLVSAVQSTMARPIAKLTTAARQTTRDQGERVQHLLESVLANFVNELEKNFGSQIRAIDELLKASTQTVANADKSFGDAITGLAEEIKGTLNRLHTNEGERFDQLNRDLETYAGELRGHVENHSRAFATTIERMLEEAAAISNSVLTQSAGDMARTAESFDALHGAVENMLTLIMPTLHRVIANQENLLAALESDASASRVISRASSEMSAAAQAGRDTVERFITLAERMREVSSTINANTAGIRNAPRRAPAAASKRLAQAANELRNVVNETSTEISDPGPGPGPDLRRE
ncbi:MAG: hypothetical protein ACE5EM_00805 [Sphingomonadales bacterium]